MNTPLYNELVKYSDNINSFHMPGHKSTNLFNINQIPFWALDVTEVPGLDNLYEANGVIQEAQKLIAKRYGAKESIFLTNGSTAGIIASILTICNPGDTLIIARNCHHSVWNALILGGIRPVYINPNYCNDHGIIAGICPKELEQLMVDYPEAKGVILVSPTYEGLVSDIGRISKIIHEYNKILIVDEAHGAHFPWHQDFPKSAISQGADIVIQSMHKTLPAITQSALIHTCSHRVDTYILTQRLQMIQTSSPSYVMMGIMDYIREQMENQKDLWNNYINNLITIRKKLSQLQNLYMIPESICGDLNIFDIDKSKFVILTNATNITGIDLGNMLRKEYNIQVEVEAPNYIIAMSTIADTMDDLNLLCNALFEIDNRLEGNSRYLVSYKQFYLESKKEVLPRDIFFGKQWTTPLDQCIGEISATNIMLYPPGIPLICIGEVFTKEIIDYIKDVVDGVLGIIKEKDKISVLIWKEGE